MRNRSKITKIHALGDALDAANTDKLKAISLYLAAREAHNLEGTDTTLTTMRETRADLEAARADYTNAFDSYITALRQYNALHS
jgi:hypothetical protein